jgi:hypothetical protein
MLTATADPNTARMPMMSFCFHSIRTMESGENFGAGVLRLMEFNKLLECIRRAKSKTLYFQRGYGDTGRVSGY